MYLFDNLFCFRGLTKIGITITPTVKRQIGATTINIDSKDMNSITNIKLNYINSRNIFLSHAYLYLVGKVS